jgi:hypothetical protein
VRTDHPAVSCMGSQYAGWAIQVDKYFAMGSGPLRAHARVEKELFEKLEYAEAATCGVLVLMMTVTSANGVPCRRWPRPSAIPTASSLLRHTRRCTASPVASPDPRAKPP